MNPRTSLCCTVIAFLFPCLPLLPAADLKVEPLCVVPRDAPGSQLVRLRLEGDVPVPPKRVTVEAPGKAAVEIPLGQPAKDLRTFTVAIPGVEHETELKVTVIAEEPIASASFALRPTRPWRLFLVQHTHTDIGYTDLPSRINVDHLEFIDEAVQACDWTDDYPEAARFRWTCEGTWAVERYLRERPPEKVARFLERVREGRIEVTAMSMNMTDLATEEVVARSFLPVARLRALGIPIRSAMQCDVNGYPWCLPEMLADVGVRGLAGGINHTRSTLPYAHPRAISWESPGGASVLAWRGEHYMFANMLGFRESVDKVLERMPGYLLSLERRGYPYKSALLQMAGYFTDNAAPCHRASDLAKEWNARFAFPEVRLATLSEALDAVRAENAAPSTRQAWPDWWADGVGSAAIETAVVREAQETLAFAETFLALARVLRPGQPDLRRAAADAYLAACIYDEHTFGAAESVSRPLTINTKTQWSEKAATSHRARWIATELESAALSAWAEDAVPEGETGIAVFNALSWDRAGPLTFRLPRGTVEEGTPFRVIDPETQEDVPVQLVRASTNYRDFEMVARGVPPVGYKVYRLEAAAATAATAPAAAAAVVAADPFRVEKTSISNGLTAVELDPARAAIASIRPAAGGGSIIGNAAHGFNQYVHERIVDPKGREHLWPPQDAYAPSAFKADTPRDAAVEPGAAGPVRRSLRMVSKLAVPAGEVKVESEVSLYRGLPGVFIENRIVKPESFEPEASYFAFPFAGADGPRAEVAGGVMVPGRDQIPGSACDWHAIQRWVRVEETAAAGAGRTGHPGAVWVTIDVPLMQFGGLNTGRWGKGLTLEKPLLYSWAMNNYWFTNFVASQRGQFVFRYAVAGGECAASDAAANRFGREICSPLKATVAVGRGQGPRRRSFIRVEPAEVAIVAVKEAEKEPRGLVVRLRNLSDEPRKAAIVLGPPLAPRSAVRAGILEDPREELPLEGGAARFEVGPRGLATVLFRF